MQPSITVIIPAWNEGVRIGSTLSALQAIAPRLEEDGLRQEIIVVDDGSQDYTAEIAASRGCRVIRHECNKGKGAAMNTGIREAEGQLIVFLDADLGSTAGLMQDLLAPVASGAADMSVAVLPRAARKGGIGLVKGLAAAGIYWLSGYRPTAPLSGQRAVHRRVLERIGGVSEGFGVEVGLTIDAARAGFRIVEVEVPFRHRETGRDWQGFVHRGKQFVHVGRTLLGRWRTR